MFMCFSKSFVPLIESPQFSQIKYLRSLSTFWSSLVTSEGSSMLFLCMLLSSSDVQSRVGRTCVRVRGSVALFFLSKLVALSHGELGTVLDLKVCPQGLQLFLLICSVGL